MNLARRVSMRVKRSIMFVSSFIRIPRCFFADLVIWDMPYGLGVAPWDVLLTDHELETFFQQLAVVNRSRAHALCLGCIWHDAGRVQMQQCACARDSHAVLNKQTRRRRVPATKNQTSKQKALFRTPNLGGLEHLIPRSKS